MLWFTTMQGKHAESSFLTVGEAAKRVGVSRDTLKRWEADGRIHALRTPTGHRRYHVKDVDNLLREVSA